MRAEKGRFKEKHAPETIADPGIAQSVSQKVRKGKVTCVDAELIASELHKSMQEVGVVLDLLEVSLISCQLGLFGYDPQKKIVVPAKSVEKEITAAITEKLVNGCLPCQAAWQIAEALACPKMKVAAVCEATNMKIKPCQLGAFKQ